MSEPARLEWMRDFLHGLRPTLNIAHRGGAALAPENTLWAFEQAVTRWGADVIELDVQATADGVLVVFHDETLERCTNGAGRVDAQTWAAISALDAGWPMFAGRGARVPRLQDVLDALPHVRMNIELKAGDAAVVEQFVRTLRAHDALERVCIGSEADAVADRLFAACPEACHFFPAEALSAWVFGVKTGAATPPDPRFSVVDMPNVWQGVSLVDAALLHAAQAAGLWVNVWTVDEPEEMARLIALGVGGIMTDRPDLLRDALRAPQS